MKMKTLARQRDTAELLRRLRQVHPESARRWGRMTAHQMVCHLADAFRLAIGEKPSRRAPSLLDRTIVKWVALYVPLPWPGGIIRTTPEVDQEAGGTRSTDFEADLAQVEALLATVAGSTDLDRQVHPIFGRMSNADWLRWGYLHADHHLRQFGA